VGGEADESLSYDERMAVEEARNRAVKLNGRILEVVAGQCEKMADSFRRAGVM